MAREGVAMQCIHSDGHATQLLSDERALFTVCGVVFRAGMSKAIQSHIIEHPLIWSRSCWCVLCSRTPSICARYNTVVCVRKRNVVSDILVLPSGSNPADLSNARARPLCCATCVRPTRALTVRGFAHPISCSVVVEYRRRWQGS